MKLVYTPADGERREWEYDPSEVTAAEAEAVEDVTGSTWEEVNKAAGKGGIRARRAILWMLLRRDHAVLRFADVVFRVGELEWQFGRRELESMRDLARTMPLPPGVTEAEREAGVAQFDKLIAAADHDGPGKAPSGTAASGTRRRSPGSGAPRRSRASAP